MCVYVHIHVCECMCGCLEEGGSELVRLSSLGRFLEASQCRSRNSRWQSADDKIHKCKTEGPIVLSCF